MPNILNLFDFKDYRSVIKQNIESNRSERGYQKKLSNAAGCHTSYFSQVMNSHIHLTPDQAMGLCQFWSFDPDETTFFLALVMIERASTPSLKRHFSQQIERVRVERTNIAKRVAAPENKLSPEAQLRYYSAWYFAATHMLLSVPSLRTPETIAARLALPIDLVDSTLKALESMGLAQHSRGQWNATSLVLHVPAGSPLNAINHGHWRQLAAQRVQENRMGEVHYSAFYTLSQTDYVVLREQVMRLVEKSREIVAPSKEETAAVFVADLFPM